MLYCYCPKNPHKDYLEREMDIAKKNNNFIYFDYDTGLFFDKNNHQVEVKGKEVWPVSGVFQLEKLVNTLQEQGAIILNSMEDIHKIEEWYKYIEPKRTIISFQGKMLNDAAFLTYLHETFYEQAEVFLKTKAKDFNGIIDFSDLFDENSDLRKAFAYHEEEEFLISPKVEIDKDEMDNQEYRALIWKGKIMNISRIVDKTYHTIPEEVLAFILAFLHELPPDFPTTFALDVFSYQGILDILELNPIEASGKYLYNSIFACSNDLLHQDVTRIPQEKDTSDLSFEYRETKSPSTTKDIPKTFANDYKNIRQFGERVEGYVHIYGLPEGVKINLAELLAKAMPVESMQEVPMSEAEKEMKLKKSNET